jgi:diguanylate cyclase
MFSRMIGQHVERELLIAQLRASNDQLASHALTDSLTGLQNRRSLIDELSRMLARAWREQGSLSVAFIDLDGFKAINDEHGHEIGDRFLAAMARRLSDGLRAGDLIARMGGDEFVIVAPVPADASQGLSSERLTQRTRAVFDLGGLRLDYPGASVGVVTIEPGELSAEEVLKLADSAMYDVKRQRRLADERLARQ